MEISEHRMFFNSSFSGKFDHIDNEKIIRESYILKEIDGGNIKTNIGGWQSSDLDEENAGQETMKLANSMTQAVNNIFSLYKENMSLRLDNFWVNINKSNDFNLAHNHPKSVMSGCYYAKCTEDSGKFVFIRPDIQNHYISSTGENEYVYGAYSFVPEPGLFLIFPSYLEHYVYPNMNDDDRISLAFNWIE